MVRKYDALFILPATLKEEELDATLKRIEDLIASLEGKTSDVHILGKRSFARPTKRLEAGYYVKMRVDLEPTRIEGLRARLKLDDGVFRAQILRGSETTAVDKEPEAEPATDEGSSDGQL